MEDKIIEQLKNEKADLEVEENQLKEFTKVRDERVEVKPREYRKHEEKHEEKQKPIEITVKTTEDEKKEAVEEPKKEEKPKQAEDKKPLKETDDIWNE